MDFDIPPQSLSAALDTFAAQSRQPILVTPEMTANRMSKGVAGPADTKAALSRILEGTGLTYRTEGKTFLIVQAGEGGSSPQGVGAGGDVEALIVTAQKREENIQDVPIAMSAFSQEDLTTHQIAGGPDLMTQVPNMTFTKTNFSSYSIQIRGIGTQAISATVDPAVAVAFNNTPFIRNRFFEQEFYDLQRIEVLRGPQGTLYGRNATAGVVNIISAKPKFNYEAKLSGDVSNYSSTRLEGMVNIPLAEDAVALRIAGAWTKRDGYVENEITGNPIDGRDLWSTRVSLRVAPTAGIDVNLIWEHFEENDDRLRSGKQLCHQDDRTEVQGYTMNREIWSGYGLLYSQGCLPASLYGDESFEAPDGFSLPYVIPLRTIGAFVREGFDPYLSKVQSRDLRVIESTVDPEYWAKSDLVELQANFDLTEGLTLTSETAYGYDELFSMQDFNRFNTRPGVFLNPSEILAGIQASDYREDLLIEGPNGGIFCDPQIGCADRLVAIDISTARSRQFSQEFRIGSDFDGPFNFSLGANFLRYDTEDKYYVFINTVSMMAASGGWFISGSDLPPYVPNVSDNHQCLAGRPFPDPDVPQAVSGCQFLDVHPIGSLDDDGHNYFLSRNPYKLISYAVFGEAYYNLADNLKITAGLRWTVDKKEAPRIPSWLLGSETVGLPVAEVVEQEWREPTGRLTIDWKPNLGFTDETLLYASYAHGYKAGGANPPRAGKLYWAFPEIADALNRRNATKPKTFEPEFVDAFELGMKNTLLDGRLTANLAAFYYDYKAYQISQIVDRSAYNYNFDARVWGLEAELDWRPLENLRLGFKGGYENTEVGEGAQAVDIMDRTAGMEDWFVVRPFPAYSENCVLPASVVASGGVSLSPPVGTWASGFPGPCEVIYYQGQIIGGYDPNVDVGQNYGEGFFKDLSGNELPNAPHFTATITADYTIPLPSDWLMTLHTDLYYQSEAWTRIFNTEGYDKLKAYTNVNLAAIFVNEDAGWNIMAYVKNVMDRDSITGAFLNPDDVGLTTNVFLTEPRLYGIRVTKNWSGAPWWSGSAHTPGEPYPFAVEVGGQIVSHDAPYDPVTPTSVLLYQEALSPIGIQNGDLDRNAGGEVKLTWRPAGSPWLVSGGVRFGKTKGFDTLDAQAPGDTGCYLYNTAVCAANPAAYRTAIDWVEVDAINHEKHVFADFEVGQEFGLGGLASTVSAGLRYAELESATNIQLMGVPDWDLPEFNMLFGEAQRHYFDTDVTTHREFKGVGPILAWDASKALLGDDAKGHLDIDWSVTGGVLFGKQKVFGSGEEVSTYYSEKYSAAQTPTPEGPPTAVPGGPAPRSTSTTVPFAGVELGLSYGIQRFKVSAGYRWERYFDVLDGGFTEHKSYDRTIDGPYFKVAIGFGG